MYRDTSSYFLLRSGDYKKNSLQTTTQTINDIAYCGPAIWHKAGSKQQCCRKSTFKVHPFWFWFWLSIDLSSPKVHTNWLWIDFEIDFCSADTKPPSRLRAQVCSCVLCLFPGNQRWFEPVPAAQLPTFARYNFRGSHTLRTRTNEKSCPSWPRPVPRGKARGLPDSPRVAMRRRPPLFTRILHLAGLHAGRRAAAPLGVHKPMAWCDSRGCAAQILPANWATTRRVSKLIFS